MRLRWWKVLGLAGLAGVAATGVVVARGERRRRAYTPDEIRTRLHERLERAELDRTALDRAGLDRAGLDRAQR